MAEEDEPMEEENIKEEKPCGLSLQRAISTSMDSRLFHHLVSLSLSLSTCCNTHRHNIQGHVGHSNLGKGQLWLRLL